jgi:hypothetical protein
VLVTLKSEGLFVLIIRFKYRWSGHGLSGLFMIVLSGKKNGISQI